MVYSGDDVPFNYPNEVGFSEIAGGIIVPRDEINTSQDVLGNPLQFSGEVPRNGQAVGSQCLDLNGTNTHAITPIPSNFSSDCVMFCEFSPDAVAASNAGRYRIFQLAFNNSTRFGMTVDDDRVRMLYNNGSTTFTDGVDVAVGDKVRGLVRKDGTTLQLIVNGVLVDEVENITLAPVNSASIYLFSQGGGGARHFDGKVWNVQFYESLTQEQAVQLTVDGIPPKVGTAWWPLSETSGSNLAEVWHGRDATYINGNARSTQDRFHYHLAKGFSLVAGEEIPANADGVLDTAGNTITNPAGAFHNGTVTDLELHDGTWSFNDPRTNPNFHRSDDGNGNADRFLSYDDVLTGADYDGVYTYVNNTLPDTATNAVFWLDVSRTNFLTINSGAVEAMLDRSTSGNNFSEDGGDRWPVYDSVNGEAEFDGLNDSLEGFLSEDGVLVTAQLLPDGLGADAGRGFTCTGLAYDASTDTFWMGNDGRGPSGDTTHESSVINVSRDGTTIISEIDADSVYTGATSVQGVTVDTSDDTLWFALPEENRIVHCTKTGTLIGSFEYTDVNGLAYDEANDHLWVTRASGLLRRINQSGTTQESYSLSGSNWDQIQLDTVNNGLWITQGSNGSDGNLYFFDLTAGKLSEPISMVGADAIEGVYVDGSTAYILNDAYFHNGDPALNRLLTFNINVQKTLPRSQIDFTMVFSAGTLSPTDAIFTSGDPLTSEGFGFYLPSTTALRCFVHDGSGNDNADVTVDPVTTLSVISTTIDLSTGEYKVYQNGTLKGTQTLTGLGDAINWSRMQLADSPDDRNAQIQVRDVILQDNIMTDEERTDLTNYLMNKHGIT